MSKPHNKDPEGFPILDGRGKLTSRDMNGSQHYRDQVKVLASDEAGNVLEKMPIGKHRLWEGIAYISLLKGDGATFPLTHVPADPSKNTPDYDIADMHGVKVHLRDGIKPDTYGILKGRVQISVRIVQPRDRKDKALASACHYLSVNVFPVDEEPVASILIKKVKGGEKRLSCIKHWGPDFNRSHVFVCQLSENIADHATVVAEERWLELVGQWEEAVNVHFEDNEDMRDLLAHIHDAEMRQSIETELRNAHRAFSGLFLEIVNLGETTTPEQQLTAAKRWIELTNHWIYSGESELCGWLNEIEDEKLYEAFDAQINESIQELEELFRKVAGIDQPTWDKADEAVNP